MYAGRPGAVGDASPKASGRRPRSTPAVTAARRGYCSISFRRERDNPYNYSPASTFLTGGRPTLGINQLRRLPG